MFFFFKPDFERFQNMLKRKTRKLCKKSNINLTKCTKKFKKKLTKKRTTIEATKYWQLILKKDMTSALKNKTGR